MVSGRRVDHQPIAFETSPSSKSGGNNGSSSIRPCGSVSSGRSGSGSTSPLRWPVTPRSSLTAALLTLAIVASLACAGVGQPRKTRWGGGSGGGRRGGADGGGRRPSSSPPRLAQQRFAIEPQSKVATLGEDVVLACRVENKIGTLQWTRDGFGLGTDRNLSGFSRYAMVGNDEEGDYTLHIRAVTLEDDADFQCQVGAMDGVRGIRSRFARLNVRVAPDPPRIFPSDHVATTAGMKVELTCRSDRGKPAADLAWFDGEGNRVQGASLKREVEPIPDSKRENSLLTWTFHPTRHHDGQLLTCRSDNPATTDSMTATVSLEVRYPPAISLTIENERVLEGDTVRFVCAAQANPTDLAFRWFRNDAPLPLMPPSPVVGTSGVAAAASVAAVGVVGGGGSSRDVLELERVTREMNGETVSCEVRNSVGTGRSTQTLNVYYKPRFRSEVATVSAEPGAEVVLNCEVDSNPRAEITWVREGSPGVLGRQPTYVIRSVGRSDVGKYICRASVLGFQEINNEISLYLKGPPKINSPPLQYGSEGQEVHVECLVEAVPPAGRVLWEKDGQLLEVDNNQGIEMIKEPLSNGERNLLVIHQASDGDFGEYNCSAWNAFGETGIVISVRRRRDLAPFAVVLAATGGALLVVLLSVAFVFCARSRKPHPPHQQELKAAAIGTPAVTTGGVGARVSCPVGSGGGSGQNGGAGSGGDKTPPNGLGPSPNSLPPPTLAPPGHFMARHSASRHHGFSALYAAPSSAVDVVSNTVAAASVDDNVIANGDRVASSSSSTLSTSPPPPPTPQLPAYATACGFAPPSGGNGEPLLSQPSSLAATTAPPAGRSDAMGVAGLVQLQRRTDSLASAVVDRQTSGKATLVGTTTGCALLSPCRAAGDIGLTSGNEPPPPPPPQPPPPPLATNPALYSNGVGASSAAALVLPPQYALRDLPRPSASSSESSVNSLCRSGGASSMGLPFGGRAPEAAFDAFATLRPSAMGSGGINSGHARPAVAPPQRVDSVAGGGRCASPPSPSQQQQQQKYITARQNGHTIIGQVFKAGQMPAHV